MRIWKGVVGAFAVAGVAAIVAWHFASPTADAPRGHAPSSEVDIGDVAATPRAVVPPRSRMRIGDPLQQPKTEAEVAWLVRHAYPTQDEMNAAWAGLPSATEFDARDGITPREILRAELYAMQRPADARRAEAFLGQAAADGSIHALEALGRVYSVGARKDLVKSEAYYRASMLRGNWPAAMRLAPTLPRPDDIVAELMAHQVISNLNRMRAARGLPPLGYDPRPGLDEFSRAIAGARAMSAKP